MTLDSKGCELFLVQPIMFIGDEGELHHLVETLEG